MTMHGGIRHRMIKDSLYNMLHDAIDALGWFDSGRNHRAINMIAKPVEHDEEIPLNTLSLAPGDMEDEDWEIGSMLAEHTWMYYVDFYAENDAIGQHMIGDIRDVLAGRMPEANRVRPNFAVYDYRMATPTIQFYCQIEEVQIDRAIDFPKPWQKNWYTCRFVIVDYYGNESDIDGGGVDEDYDQYLDGGSP